MAIQDTDLLVVQRPGTSDLYKLAVGDLPIPDDVDVDLDYTPATDKGTITNTAGNDAELPLAGINAGLMSPDQVIKLLGIETGAQTNLWTEDAGVLSPATSGNNVFNAGSHYIGGTTARNTYELWLSTLTEQQLEQLEAGTFAAPANVTQAGDGEFARQWWYNQQDAEIQAAIDAGEIEYPEHLAAATFTDTFALGDNTNINLSLNGSGLFKNSLYVAGTKNSNSKFSIDSQGYAKFKKDVRAQSGIIITNNSKENVHNINSDLYIGNSNDVTDSYSSFSAGSQEQKSGYNATFGDYLLSFSINKGGTLESLYTTDPDKAGAGAGTTYSQRAYLQITSDGITSHATNHRVGAIKGRVNYKNDFVNTQFNGQNRHYGFVSDATSDYDQRSTAADTHAKSGGYVFYNSGPSTAVQDLVAFDVDHAGLENQNMVGLRSIVNIHTGATNYNLLIEGDAPNYIKGAATIDGGVTTEFGTDTAQLGNVAPLNDWSVYPART